AARADSLIRNEATEGRPEPIELSVVPPLLLLRHAAPLRDVTRSMIPDAIREGSLMERFFAANGHAGRSKSASSGRHPPALHLLLGGCSTMKRLSLALVVFLAVGSPRVHADVIARIGDIDGFGYGAAPGFRAANGGLANAHGDAVLTNRDFLPDIN